MGTVPSCHPSNARPPGSSSNSSKISHPRPLPSHQHFVPVSPLAATLMESPASVANKRLTARLNPLAATLTKNRGGGGSRLAHPTRMRILSPPTAEEAKDSSPASLFCTPVHRERSTIPWQPSGSLLFLKIAGVSPYNFHSGNCSQDTTPKGHFFRPFLSAAYTLFQAPYPVSPVFATVTKTAGCIPTIPILALFQLSGSLITFQSSTLQRETSAPSYPLLLQSSGIWITGPVLGILRRNS